MMLNFFPDPIPKHLWSSESKFLKSWIVFNSDDNNRDRESMNMDSYSSIDYSGSRDIDEYFKGNAANR